MTRLRHTLFIVVAVLMVGPWALAADPVASPDDAFLNALKGKWTMTGMVTGKPVRYNATGERVLQGGFLRLHMIDAAVTPSYEADVYLGFDARQQDYIVHWLDRFGAAGSRVVGSGKREGSVLTLVIPYKENDFRDTFEWHEKTGTWVLIIENQNKDGSWSVFAHYSMVPAP
jgi:Protein of unknown function (DUF1579)